MGILVLVLGFIVILGVLVGLSALIIKLGLIIRGTKTLERLDENGNVCCPICKSTQISTGLRGFGYFSQPVNICAMCGYSWRPKL